jgi:GlpG protein
MRQIGTLTTRPLAERFADFLLLQGVTTHCEEDRGEWVVWALEEDRLEFARDALKEFLAAPEDPCYLGNELRAKAIRKEHDQRNTRAARNHRQGRELWAPGGAGNIRRAPITAAMIAVCIVVFLYTQQGNDRIATSPLLFVGYEHAELDPTWDATDPMSALVDIRNGEVWRLVTPMFVHFTVIHLLFNMMWLHQLGSQLENYAGRWKYVALILALAVASSLMQALVARHPSFGGMSGVVYGLFGFIWMRVRYYPADGFVLGRQAVVMMMIWFFFCFAMGGVANGGHAGGLFLGLAIGYLMPSRK